MKLLLQSAEHTRALGQKLADFVQHNEKWKNMFFFGEVGSGKTTCIRACIRSMGVKDTVQSPTFTIVNMYALPNKHMKTFAHVDMYRHHEQQACDIAELCEYLCDETCVVAMEWAEYFPQIYFPSTRIEVHMEHEPDGTRRAHVRFFEDTKEKDITLKIAE